MVIHGRHVHIHESTIEYNIQMDRRVARGQRRCLPCIFMFWHIRVLLLRNIDIHDAETYTYYCFWDIKDGYARQICAQTLLNYCTDITQLLHRHYSTIAQTLLNYRTHYSTIAYMTQLLNIPCRWVDGLPEGRAEIWFGNGEAYTGSSVIHGYTSGSM